MNAIIENIGDALQPAVQVEAVSKHYKDKVAMDDISLRIERGETIALIGPNGAGKSTLIESIIGLKPIDKGRIKLLGKEVNAKSAKELSASIGVQLQETKLFKTWLVKEYIEVFSALYEKTADIPSLINSLGLENELNKKVEHLSGGYRQRLALLLALVNDPKIIFLDEPTTGLDPISRKELWLKIQELKSKDRTIILCTHYMEEVRELCDRIILVANGRVVASGTADELISSTPNKHATLDDAYVHFANHCA